MIRHTHVSHLFEKATPKKEETKKIEEYVNVKKAHHKANKTIVNMLIAAASIFLIPTIVENIFNIVGSNSNDIIDCFKNGNKMGVIDAYIERIESSFSKTDYNNALRYINNVNDKKVNKEVQIKRLEKYKVYVDIVSDIDSLNKNNFISKSKSIESKIDSITDPEIKNKISNLDLYNHD